MMHLLCFFRFLHLLILVLLLPASVSAGAAAAVDHGEFIYHGFSDGNLTVDGSAAIFSDLLSLNAGLTLVKDIKNLIINTILAFPEIMLGGVLSISIPQLLLSSEDEGGAPTQGSFCGRIREGLKKGKRLREERSEHQREMLQRRGEESKLFVDLSSTYPRRLSILEHFWGLSREDKAYGSVRQGLATAFLLLYTKLKTTSFIDKNIYKVSSVQIQMMKWMVDLRVVLPFLSIGFFHMYQRETAFNDSIVDVKITYAILCSTAVLEIISLYVWAVADLGNNSLRGAWPEMVAQYSVIGYFARSIRHRSWMWVACLIQCKDFLDQHWCMKSCFSSSSRKISELVLEYLKDGWKKEIQDAPRYRRFNDHSSRWVLERRSHVPGMMRMIRRPLPFDECVLLWHIATDFCFFSSSFSVSEHISASAKVSTTTTTILTRITEINKMQRGGRGRAVMSKVLPGVETSSSVDNCGQIKSQCRQMSNYMVYLLFVNPEMLLPGTRRNLFITAYDDLKDTLEDNKFARAYKEIKDILKDKKLPSKQKDTKLPLDEKDKKRNVYRRVSDAMKEMKDILRDSSRNPISWSQWKAAPVKEERIMERVISTMLDKSKNKESKQGCEEESKESPREEHSKGDSEENFIDDAWDLAQELLDLGHESGDKKMWEVIQGVWVEMLCYSASRCRGYLHAKALGNGGEFLSYVWLLLFRMGMETFTDKLQMMEDPPSHDEARSNDKAETTREVFAATSVDRLQREEHLPSQGGNQYGTGSSFEICEVADDVA